MHCQVANHEVGTLQPVDQVVAVCRRHDVLVHVDAAAAAGHVDLDLDELGADLVSVSAHKLGGPPGIGALVVRRGLRFSPLLVGGDQERGTAGRTRERACRRRVRRRPQLHFRSPGARRTSRRMPGASPNK